MTGKVKIILAMFMFAALKMQAQTNAIIFPQLLSINGMVLMTNAEFRCYSGGRIFFRNSLADYRSFDGQQLDTNILARLHITQGQLDLQQQRLDDARQREIDARQAAYIAAITPAPEPTDAVFENIKKELLDCKTGRELSETSDRICDTIDNAFIEIIENAVLNGADGTQIVKLERERDEDKLKVRGFSLGLAEKNLIQANHEQDIAQSNLNAFNADPTGYLKAHPDITNSSNSK